MMAKAILDADEILRHATPKARRYGHEIQPWGHLIRMQLLGGVSIVMGRFVASGITRLRLTLAVRGSVV